MILSISSGHTSDLEPRSQEECVQAVAMHLRHCTKGIVDNYSTDRFFSFLKEAKIHTYSILPHIKRIRFPVECSCHVVSSVLQVILDLLKIFCLCFLLILRLQINQSHFVK